MYNDGVSDGDFEKLLKQLRLLYDDELLAEKENSFEAMLKNFKKDRETKNAIYQSVVLKLSSYTYTNDNGTQNIYAPTMFIIKNGKVIQQYR